MKAKELAAKAIQQMPDSSKWEDIKERIRFLAATEKGRKDKRYGKLVSRKDVAERLQSWISQ